MGAGARPDDGSVAGAGLPGLQSESNLILKL